MVSFVRFSLRRFNMKAGELWNSCYVVAEHRARSGLGSNPLVKPFSTEQPSGGLSLFCVSDILGVSLSNPQGSLRLDVKTLVQRGCS
jgi:hypothetical protein